MTNDKNNFTGMLNFQVRNPSTNLCLDTMGKDEKTVFNIGVFSCQGGASANEVCGLLCIIIIRSESYTV